jgi:hypothetical protein
MKNILIILGFILIPFMNLDAQNFEIGIKTGFGLADTHWTNIPDPETNSDFHSPIFSFSANGVLSYKSAGFWGFTVEPGIVQKGWIQKGINSENKFKVNYIQLPILSDFHLSNKLSISIGPEVAYLLSSKYKSNYGTEKVNYIFNNFELSGVVGVTYKIVENFDVGIRYSHSITQTSDKVFWVFDELDEKELEMNDYNQYLQLFLKLNLKSVRN